MQQFGRGRIAIRDVVELVGTDNVRCRIIAQRNLSFKHAGVQAILCQRSVDVLAVASAIIEIEPGAADTDRRHNGVDLEVILILMADNACDCANAALEQAHRRLLGTVFLAVEVVFVDTKFALCPQGDDRTVNHADLGVTGYASRNQVALLDECPFGKRPRLTIARCANLANGHQDTARSRVARIRVRHGHLSKRGLKCRGGKQRQEHRRNAHGDGSKQRMRQLHAFAPYSDA